MSITRQVKLIDIILGDTVINRLTDHNFELAANGEYYSPHIPFEVASTEFSAGVDAANTVLTLQADSLPITTYKFLQSGTLHGLTFKIYFYDLDSGVARLILYAFVESVTYNMSRVEYSLVSLIARLSAVNLSKKISANCNHSFGDDFCKFDPFSVAVSHPVASCAFANRFQLTVPSIPGTENFRNTGSVKFTLNPEYGNYEFIVPYRTFGDYSGTFVVNLHTPVYLQLGTDVVGNVLIAPGCNKTKSQCAAYGNEARFGGYLGVRGKTFSDRLPVRV